MSDPSVQIIAYEGTNSWSQVKADVVNGLGLPSSQYAAAVTIAQTAQDGDPGGAILLTGHSEGGGEAALASYVTGLPAITFNAAGVNPMTYGYTNGSTAQITNYYSVTDPLSLVQMIVGKPALGTQVPVFTLGGHSMSSLATALAGCSSCGL